MAEQRKAVPRESGPDGVTVAFGLILDELNRAADEVNETGAVAFRDGDYDEAEGLMEKGRRLLAFRAKLEALKDEWWTTFEEDIRRGVSVEPERVVRTINADSRGPRTGLVVRLADGTTICERTAADTFVRTLEALGIERVRALNLQVNRHPLVALERSESYNQTESGRYLVMTHTSTAAKQKMLQQIAKALRVSIKVDIVRP